MKRVIVLAVLCLLAGAAPALAQEAKSPTDTSASSSVQAPDVAKAPAAGAVNSPRLFSKAAIEKAVAKSAAAVPQKKPFFKTPWPYVIIGAVVVIVAIALSGSSSNGIY